MNFDMYALLQLHKKEPNAHTIDQIDFNELSVYDTISVSDTFFDIEKSFDIDYKESVLYFLPNGADIYVMDKLFNLKQLHYGEKVGNTLTGYLGADAVGLINNRIKIANTNYIIDLKEALYSSVDFVSFTGKIDISAHNFLAINKIDEEVFGSYQVSAPTSAEFFVLNGNGDSRTVATYDLTTHFTTASISNAYISMLGRFWWNGEVVYIAGVGVEYSTGAKDIGMAIIENGTVSFLTYSGGSGNIHRFFIPAQVDNDIMLGGAYDYNTALYYSKHLKAQTDTDEVYKLGSGALATYVYGDNNKCIYRMLGDVLLPSRTRADYVAYVTADGKLRDNCNLALDNVVLASELNQFLVVYNGSAIELRYWNTFQSGFVEYIANQGLPASYYKGLIWANEYDDFFAPTQLASTTVSLLATGDETSGNISGNFIRQAPFVRLFFKTTLDTDEARIEFDIKIQRKINGVLQPEEYIGSAGWNLGGVYHLFEKEYYVDVYVGDSEEITVNVSYYVWAVNTTNGFNLDLTLSKKEGIKKNIYKK